MSQIYEAQWLHSEAYLLVCIRSVFIEINTCTFYRFTPAGNDRICVPQSVNQTDTLECHLSCEQVLHFLCELHCGRTTARSKWFMFSIHTACFEYTSEFGTQCLLRDDSLMEPVLKEWCLLDFCWRYNLEEGFQPYLSLLTCWVIELPNLMESGQRANC